MDSNIYGRRLLMFGAEAKNHFHSRANCIHFKVAVGVRAKLQNVNYIRLAYVKQQQISCSDWTFFIGSLYQNTYT
jgi:hypothetical protein